MMQKNTHGIKCNESERGIAIVLVLVVLMTLTMLAVGVLTSSITNNALSRNYERNTQAVNMSEIGVKVAYREFINSGFLRTTHTMNGEAPAMGDDLLLTSLSDFYVDENGDFAWEWDDSKPYDPMWDTDLPHGFRFRVHYTSNFAFLIECNGWYGNIRKRTRARGEIETLFQFSYFGAQDLGEFVRGAAQEIRGKVHANGDMYIRPSGAALNINSSAVTAAGLIIRSRDAWGRPDTDGECWITKGEQDSGDWEEMNPGIPRGEEGKAFDSLHEDWSDKEDGARAKWGGVVRDKVPYKSPPPVMNLEQGGYYDQEADFHIDSTTHIAKTWCEQVNFWNWNEQRWVTVEDIDVGAMIAVGDWPANGLIYSSVPCRLSNATQLDGKFMFASKSTIYTKGNFNTINKQGASLMTKHRIYHLSDNWDDAESDDSKNRNACDTAIYGALVDGAPTIDEYNWVDRDGDNKYDDSGMTIYNPESPKKAGNYTPPNNDTNPWANCDDLLEKWKDEDGDKYTLTKFGSVVHLGGAEMCPNLDNAGLTSDQLAWVQKTGYGAPDRNYSYDSDLADPENQPPYTPLIGHITSWAPF